MNPCLKSRSGGMNEAEAGVSLLERERVVREVVSLTVSGSSQKSCRLPEAT